MQSRDPDFGPKTPAAVLVLVYPHLGEPHIVLTLRSEALPDHPGQISFPGGVRDPEDFDLAVTALREANEEVGIVGAHVTLLGLLPEVPVGPFLVTPYVGTMAYRPEFIPSPDEVAELIEVPVRILQEPSTLQEELWEMRGQQRVVQFYRHGRHQIWGATARVIQHFLASAYVDLAVAGLER